MPFIGDEQKRAMDARVESVSIIPSLPIAINLASISAVQMNILSSPDPPGRSILKVELECVWLPEIYVGTKLNLASQGYIDVLQEA